MKSRLRLSEAVTVLCVLALAVVAAWPALGEVIGADATNIGIQLLVIAFLLIVALAVGRIVSNIP